MRLRFVSWTVWKPGKVSASGDLQIRPECSYPAPHPAPAANYQCFHKLSGDMIKIERALFSLPPSIHRVKKPMDNCILKFIYLFYPSFQILGSYHLYSVHNLGYFLFNTMSTIRLQTSYFTFLNFGIYSP